MNYRGTFEVVDHLGGNIYLRDPLEGDDFTSHVDTVALAPGRDKEDALPWLRARRIVGTAGCRRPKDSLLGRLLRSSWANHPVSQWMLTYDRHLRARTPPHVE